MCGVWGLSLSGEHTELFCEAGGGGIWVESKMSTKFVDYACGFPFDGENLQSESRNLERCALSSIPDLT